MISCKVKSTFCATAALLASALLATAQSSDKNVVGNESSVRLSDSEREDMGDIRPAKPDSFLSHLRGSVQAREEFVTNAKLLGNHSSGDLLSFPTGEVGFNHALGHGLSIDTVVRAESAVYADHGNRSFWGFSGNTFLDWRPKPTCPRLFVGAEPYHYTSYDTGHRLSEAMVFSTGIDNGYVFNEHRTLLTVAYKFSDHFASPAQDDRYVNCATVSLTHQFRPALFGQLFYQFQYSDYINEPRRDSRHVVGGNVIYQFTAHLYGSFGADFIDNDSTQALATYQNFAAHAGLTLQF
ncbi:MAG: hypothetical protein QOD99_1132 [Chthoniobacter sp.]|jgi:hypothetical protein|nr:hypothetical protein [Chthoniobacter sp.]